MNCHPLQSLFAEMEIEVGGCLQQVQETPGYFGYGNAEVDLLRQIVSDGPFIISALIRGKGFLENPKKEFHFSASFCTAEIWICPFFHEEICHCETTAVFLLISFSGVVQL